VDKQKFSRLRSGTSCAGFREAVEIVLSPETGTAPGETPVTQEGSGDRFFRRVSGPGDWLISVWQPSNRQVGAVRPGEAPPSHAWRGLASFMPGFGLLNPATQIMNDLPVMATSGSLKGRNSHNGHGDHAAVFVDVTDWPAAVPPSLSVTPRPVRRARRETGATGRDHCSQPWDLGTHRAPPAVDGADLRQALFYWLVTRSASAGLWIKLWRTRWTILRRGGKQCVSCG
jgi:hypothetical protein